MASGADGLQLEEGGGMSGKPNNGFQIAKCEECGDVMKMAEPRDSGKYICRNCYEFFGVSLGNGCQGHYDDDPSGASGSWDNAVKMCER